ncbi:hypothetical protein [Maricaulis sp.]|uniref:hypothetical protein n=1 Tax=Maricaulis sp. TaxID=1486257 RepID=UPI003A952790
MLMQVWCIKPAMQREGCVCDQAGAGSMNTLKLLAASVLAAGLITVSAVAQQPRLSTQGGFTEQFIGSRLSFTTDPGLSNYTLTVTGPDGYHGQIESARVAPTFRLADFGSVPDGLYSYEMTAATTEQQVLATPPVSGADGRSGRTRPALVGTSMSGSFRVVNGQILQMDPAASER